MSLMQIPRKIEYALRAMIYLADHPAGVARGTEIATREHIPKYYLEKVIRDLMRRGLVHARRGPGGGYQLARKADTVTFRDIIEAVEGPITLNVCTDGSSSCALQPTCRMYRVWEKGQRVLLEVFSDTVTFRDIIEAVEGPITLNVCTDGSSSCALQPTCRMYRVWEKGQRVLLEVFSDTSLAEIAASRPSLPICPPDAPSISPAKSQPA